MDYNTFKGNLTFTFDGCSSYWSAYWDGTIIFLCIAVLILFIIVMVLLHKNIKYREFIREENLRKKFMEFKKLEKGIR